MEQTRCALSEYSPEYASKIKSLESECERVKKELQVSDQAHINVEQFYLGNDLEMTISREKLDEVVEPFLEEVKKCTEDALEEAFF